MSLSRPLEIKVSKPELLPEVKDLLDQAYHFAINGQLKSACNVFDHIAKKYFAYVDKASKCTAKGFAESGHFKEAEQFLEIVGNKYPMLRLHLLPGMAQGFAQGGYKAEAFKLLTIANVQKYPLIFNLLMHSSMATGFASSGRAKEVCELLELISDPHSFLFGLAVNSMLENFVENNHMTAAAEVMKYMGEKYPETFVVTLKEFLNAIAKKTEQVVEDVGKSKEEKDEISQETEVQKKITAARREFVLEVLTIVENRSLRRQAVRELAPYLDTSRLLLQADKRSWLMFDHAISYTQLKWWLDPVLRMQMLSLESFGLKKTTGTEIERERHLPLEIARYIATFLPPMEFEAILDFNQKFRQEMNKICTGRFFPNSQYQNRSFFTNALKMSEGLAFREQQSPLPPRGVIDMLVEAPLPKPSASKKVFCVEEQKSLKALKARKAREEQQIPPKTPTPKLTTER